MPAGDQFSFLGPYTGFRECLEKVDVSGAYLTKPQTLAEISQMYWLSYKLSATASISAQGLSVTDVTLGELTPSERICEGESDETYDPVSPGLFYRVGVGMSAKLTVYKMYDGNVNFESNLIGYGLKDSGTGGGDGSASVYAIAGAWTDGGQGRVGTTEILTTACLYGPDDATVESQGWWYDLSLLGNNTTTSGVTVTATAVNIGGLDLIRLRWDDGTGQADITDLEFYTY